MKKISSLLIISVFSLIIISSCGNEKKYATVKVKNEADSVSYYIGLDFGTKLKQAKIDSVMNYNAFMKGVTEAVYGDTLPVSTFEMQTYINQYFMKFQEEQIKREYKDFIAQNEEFMKENSKRDSVITLPSGLQYVVILEGQGVKPTRNDVVKVHYTGKLVDGTIFDSSYQRNEPAEFPVGQVIPGWVEALQLMPVGSKWRVFIPENLAYGSQPPRGSVIKPYATLIFDVELLDIVKQSN